MTCEIRVLAGKGLAFDYSEDADNTLSFEKQAPGGSYRAAWQTHFRQGVGMPKRLTPVALMDTESGKCFWYGRVDQWSLQDFDGCQGVISMTAVGGSAGLSDRVFRRRTVFGPRSSYIVGKEDPPTQILIPRDAVTYAVTQIGNNVFMGSIVDAGGLFPAPTQDFMGRTALEVVEYVTGLYAYLGTPVLWYVQPLNGAVGAYFSWKFYDPTVWYEVHVGAGHGTTINLSSRPSELYNEAVVPWGTAQPAIAPDPNLMESIDYSKISVIRDKVANLSGREANWYNATNLAHGILTRQNAMNFGWGVEIRIPRGEPITLKGPAGAGTLKQPWMLEEGHTISLLGIDPADWPEGETPPSQIFVTNVRYDSSQGELVVTGGEPLDIAAVNTLRTAGATAIAVSGVVKSPSATSPSPETSGTPLPPSGPNIPPSVTLGPVIGGGGDFLGGAAATGANNVPNQGSIPIVGANSANPNGDPHAATSRTRPDGSNMPNNETGAAIDQAAAPALPTHFSTIIIHMTGELEVVGDGGALGVAPMIISEYTILTNPNVAPSTFEVKFCQTTSGNEKFRVSIAASHEKVWTKLATPLKIDKLDKLFYFTTVADVTPDLWASIILRYEKRFPGHPNAVVGADHDPFYEVNSLTDVRNGFGDVKLG